MIIHCGGLQRGMLSRPEDSPVFRLPSNIPLGWHPSDLPMPLGGPLRRRVVPSLSESSAETPGRHSAEPNEGLFGFAELAISLMDDHPMASHLRSRLEMPADLLRDSA
jgi:hypothetical protein